MRKKLIFMLSALMLLLPRTARSGPDETPAPGLLEEWLREAVAGKKARIGIAVILNGTDTVTVNNDYRYPMMSVVKFHQALSVAAHLERRGQTLAERVYVGREALLPDTYSPLRDRYPQGDTTFAVSELLTYTLQLSDNNACDILFREIGGPAATDRFIRSLGIEGFAVAATEEQMHRNTQACCRNWSHPLDAALLLEMLLTRPLFEEPSMQEFIVRTMTECDTGRERLPAPLAGTGAVIGHKTGTGDTDAQGRLTGVNDIGFVLLPDGRHYTVAVFITDSEEPLPAAERIIADISGIVYQFMTQTK